MAYSLKNVLKNVYRLDDAACALILDRFSSEHASIIEEFITQSASVCLTPSSEQHASILQPLDALLRAPQTHQLLFENEYVRILESRIEPGENVPFHTHQWDGLYVILQGSRFTVKDQQGNVTEEEWKARVESFKGDTQDSILYSYTNRGLQPFISLAFEIKN